MSEADRRARRKKKQQRQRLGLFLCVLVIALLAIIFAAVFKGCSGKEKPVKPAPSDPSAAQQTTRSAVETASSGKKTDPEPEPEPELPPEPTTAAISLRCAGDIMGHLSQIEGAYVKETDSYDFKPVFSLIKPYMQDCDICMANIETTFKGSKPWQGYPGFNSPDELLYDIVDTGIKVALLSNNHMFDTRITGLLRGHEMFREAGVMTAGAQKDGEENYTIIEINNVKLGIIAYTYETSMYNGLHTVNGIAIPADDYDNMNGFGYQNYDADLAKIKDTIDRCKAAGAQVIVAYMHWGEEYQNSANNWQKRIAQDLADNGADMIIASHPHVVQEIDEINVARDGHLHKIPVFYSIGNFVSNQRQETLSNKYTENGLLACVDFVYSYEEERIIDIKYGAVPTWVERYNKNGRRQYYIVPLTEGFEEYDFWAESGHLNRAKQALEDLKKIVGGEEKLWLN
ncbi:MAG: CapA family protein [Firmicutes bacterium]|nr:CapA family protein [Bacillota bacterium]